MRQHTPCQACSLTINPRKYLYLELLICTDGWAAYPNSIMRTFREKVKKTTERGRACLEIWPNLCIATVIKGLYLSLFLPT